MRDVLREGRGRMKMMEMKTHKGDEEALGRN